MVVWQIRMSQVNHQIDLKVKQNTYISQSPNMLVHTKMPIYFNSLIFNYSHKYILAYD